MAPPPSPPPRGRLQVEPVRATAETLRRRILERFPGSSLGELAGELVLLADETASEARRLRRPLWWLRGLVALAILALLVTAASAAWLFVDIASREQAKLVELIQGTDAAVNEVILLGLTVLFLVSAETRLKRRRSLRLLHRLRGLAHVVDMHQLTKDPEAILNPGRGTASSPKRQLDRYELTRYLDYCAELLSLLSKLAALHTQVLQDPVVLDAVNDVEGLTDGLANRIWQKIMILDVAAGTVDAAAAITNPAPKARTRRAKKS